VLLAIMGLAIKTFPYYKLEDVKNLILKKSPDSNSLEHLKQ